MPVMTPSYRALARLLFGLSEGRDPNPGSQHEPEKKTWALAMPSNSSLDMGNPDDPSPPPLPYCLDTGESLTLSAPFSQST